jgi:hypothetical protein
MIYKHKLSLYCLDLDRVFFFKMATFSLFLLALAFCFASSTPVPYKNPMENGTSQTNLLNQSVVLNCLNFILLSRPF